MQAKGKYLEVQILRRRKNKAVHPMVMDRLSRLPRKLMPRMFKGFTRKQTTITSGDTLEHTWYPRHQRDPSCHLLRKKLPS